MNSRTTRSGGRFLPGASRASVLAILALAAMLLPTAPAHADSITFVFTCQVVTSLTPDQCIEGGSGGPAGPFGTLTLSDSAIDSNRVDITWTMTPQWGTNIERVLLNWAGPPSFPISAPDLYLVSQSAPAGSTTNITGTTHIFGNDGQTQGNTYRFDIRVNESSPQGLTFAASIYLTSGNGATIIDLSPGSFLATSTNLNGATPPLYALYATAQPGVVTPGWTTSNGTEFWAGVTSNPIPEPASLMMLGTGLLGGAWTLRRRRRS
jgi:hypothetical protein